MTAPKRKSETDTAAAHVKPPRRKESADASGQREVERAMRDAAKGNEDALTELSKW